MHRVLIIASALAVVTVGSASAQDFKLSEPNSAPVHVLSRQASVGGSMIDREIDREIVTSSIGTTPRAAGFSMFSAAQGFAPSDPSNSPTPRFQR